MPFVHGISISEKDEAITKAIIIMAENIGLKSHR
jgi:EAL domain-containing protein (putative c-di-GMP-specific phosphodiesterase class I)